MSAPVTAPAPVPPRSASPALAAAVVAGALVAVQQRLNGELKTALTDALLTAVVSFGTGLLAVLAVVLSRPAARAAFGLVRQVPWPQRLGGLGGALLVAVGAAAAPEIGVALLTVGLVAGQTGGGLLVDRLGLGPGGAHALTLPRIGGAALCLVAVGISVLGEGARSADPLLLVLVVLAGLGVAVQQALNGRVRRSTGDAGVAVLVNFLVGGAALVLGWLVHVAYSGLQVGPWPGPEQWYLYAGGPLGAAFVAVAALTVRRLGVLRLGLAIISGQLVGALLLDLTVPVHDQAVDVLTVVGVLLTMVAVAISGRAARP
ncbi:MAG: DMT family transporter [Mycobacteriales bacterium]